MRQQGGPGLDDAALGRRSAGPCLDELRLVLDGCLDRLVEVQKPRCVGTRRGRLAAGRGDRLCAGIRARRLCPGHVRNEGKEKEKGGAEEHRHLMLQSGAPCTDFLGEVHVLEVRHPGRENVVIAMGSQVCNPRMSPMCRQVGSRLGWR